MNRILLTALVSGALFGAAMAEAPSTPASDDHKSHHENMEAGKTHAEMAKECDERLGKIKDMGTSLPPEMKADFDYNLKLAGVESEASKDANPKNHHKHASLCHRALTIAEKIVHKHDHQVAQEKKMEEHKAKLAERKAKAQAKAEERKAKAEERKAKAAERKAKREAAKAEREAAKAEKIAAHHKDQLMKEDEKGTLDHGKLEGVDKAASSLSDEKKP